MPNSPETEPKAVMEALIFASGEEGISLKELAEWVQLPVPEVRDMLDDLVADYQREPRGIQVIQLGERYVMTTKPELASFFEKAGKVAPASTLSQAQLETLAIVAYRQPITRMEIEAIRGVKAEKALHSLIQRGLVQEVGRLEGIGRAILYGTTPAFLQHFGLRSLEDLPPLEKEDPQDELLFK